MGLEQEAYIEPSRVTLEEGDTLTVYTPVGVVSIVCQGGKVRFFVPPSVKVDHAT